MRGGGKKEAVKLEFVPAPQHLNHGMSCFLCMFERCIKPLVCNTVCPDRRRLCDPKRQRCSETLSVFNVSDALNIQGLGNLEHTRLHININHVFEALICNMKHETKNMYKVSKTLNVQDSGNTK